MTSPTPAPFPTQPPPPRTAGQVVLDEVLRHLPQLLVLLGALLDAHSTQAGNQPTLPAPVPPGPATAPQAPPRPPPAGEVDDAPPPPTHRIGSIPWNVMFADRLSDSHRFEGDELSKILSGQDPLPDNSVVFIDTNPLDQNGKAGDPGILEGGTVYYHAEVDGVESTHAYDRSARPIGNGVDNGITMGEGRYMRNRGYTTKIKFWSIPQGERRTVYLWVSVRLETGETITGAKVGPITLA